MLVEVCANSLQSALNAEEAGADRVELCVELGVGGVTPSQGLIQLVSERLSLPVHVLIRPRSGHFTYSTTEFEVMQQDIALCKSIGVQGIVSGVLLSDGHLDYDRTKVLVEAAKPLHFTFHRAFDWVPNPLTTLAQLETLGADTVLTSGQHPGAEQGLDNLTQWQRYTSLTIMAGGGVHTENAGRFKQAGLSALHFSGTAFEDAIALDNRIPMNAEKHLQEQRVAVTNTATIRQIIQTVK